MWRKSTASARDCVAGWDERFMVFGTTWMATGFVTTAGTTPALLCPSWMVMAEWGAGAPALGTFTGLVLPSNLTET